MNKVLNSNSFLNKLFLNKQLNHFQKKQNENL